MLAELVNEHLAEVANHPEVCADLKVLSRRRRIEEYGGGVTGGGTPRICLGQA